MARYWRQAREAYYGEKLEEICPEGTPKWDEAWENLQKGSSSRLSIDIYLHVCTGFEGITALLEKNGSGSTLIMGTQVTYCDLIVASMLESIFLIVPDEWDRRVKHWDGGRWEKHRDHCGDWRSIH